MVETSFFYRFHSFLFVVYVFAEKAQIEYIHSLVYTEKISHNVTDVGLLGEAHRSLVQSPWREGCGSGKAKWPNSQDNNVSSENWKYA